ncbi:MAG TPA: hemolysin family protein [Thermomicrobiaceae bacterium]|nr:hemolysin family protein [Thermomicrobiaceae bacterium]
MSTDTWLEPAVAVAALSVLTLASIVEASLATVNRLTLRELIEGRAGAHRVESLIERPQSIRSSMVLIELVAAATSVTMLSRIFDRETPRFVMPLTLVVGSLALILAAGVLPSILTSTERTEESRRFLRMASALSMAAWPLRLIATGLERALAVVLRRKPAVAEQSAAVESDESAGDGGDDDYGLQEEEQEMISGVLGLDSATVREIMVPRMDVVAVEEDVPVADVVDLIRTGGHSRIPIYRDSIDTVVGVLYAKDLLRFVREESATVKLLDLIRPAYFVPDSKHVDELLRDLQQAKVHVAVVVDEYGGTAGIVTIEDILEEIVGEIQDEYDRESPLIERVGPDEVVVDGLISVDEIADIFQADFAEGDTGTVGGFVQRRLGRIPVPGERVRADGLFIEVQSVEHHRIRKVRIERVPDEAVAAAPAHESEPA